MSWCHTCDIKIPKVVTQNGRTYYAIIIRQNSSNAQRNRVPQYSMLRSYSEFRLLYKTLLRATKPSSESWISPPSLYLKSRNLLVSNCHCQNVPTHKPASLATMCPFQNLCAKLDNLAFPARQILLSNPRDETPLLHRRRIDLMSFLSILQDFFSQFPASLLESKYQDQNCAVMNAWMVFLNMDQYFEFTHGMSSELKVYHPLRLTAWHRARHLESEKCSVGIDEGRLCSAELQRKDDWIEPLESTLAAADSPKEDVDCSQITLGKSSFKALATLNIRPLSVDTTETILEDFRDHLLHVYGNHFDGLRISLLSERSRWELSLYIACCIGHIYAVRLILFYHCDSNVTLEGDTSCLHVAARLGHTEIVQLLIENGADVNCTNHAGITPLIAACRHGKIETVKYLVELGADVSMHSLRRTYPLHAAIVAGNCDIVSYLISKGANVNVPTINGITPLHFAVELGNSQVCRILLRNSADVFHETNIGSNALMIAKAHDFADLYRLLKWHAHYQRFGSIRRYFSRPESR